MSLYYLTQLFTLNLIFNQKQTLKSVILKTLKKLLKPEEYFQKYLATLCHIIIVFLPSTNLFFMKIYNYYHNIKIMLIFYCFQPHRCTQGHINVLYVIFLLINVFIIFYMTTGVCRCRFVLGFDRRVHHKPVWKGQSAIAVWKERQTERR